MRKRRLIFSSALIIILILLYFFLKPSFNSLSDYLSKTEQVKANILIVEGWLPFDGIQTAANEFRKDGYEYLITTGLKSTTDYYEVTMDGYLIFYPKDKFTSYKISGEHIIEVRAYSGLDGKNSAHFNLFMNDSAIANYFADRKKSKYGATWQGKLSDIDSIMVQFDNDEIGQFGDRNLYVKEIIIDHKITIPFLNNSVYDLGKLGRIINNYSSNAEHTRDKLFSMGVDSSRIIAVPGKKTIINRTLTSAIALRDYLSTSKIDVKGINIVSYGTHARRTWMTYSKVLGKSYKIGIISLPDYRNNASEKRKVIKTLRETIAIIYYWIILLPYQDNNSIH